MNWEMGYEGLLDLRLFDASGHLIYQREDNSSFIRSISVADLPTGVYFLTATYEGEKITKKVLITR